MFKNASRGELSALTIVLCLAAISWGCKWDADTTERFKEWKKTVCDTIKSASAEKEKCKTLYPDNATRREDCIMGWDNDVLKPLHQKKAAAADAFLACDDETLELLKEGAKELIKKAAEAAGKKITGFTTATPCNTNFRDPLNDADVDFFFQGQQISQSGNLRTYSLSLSSYATVSWGAQAVPDTYCASGTIQLRISSQPPLAGRLSVDVVDMDITFDTSAIGGFFDQHMTENPTNPINFNMQGILIGVGFLGRMCGWLDYDQGSYLTSMAATLSTNMTTFTLSSQSGETGSDIFPEDAEPVSPYVLYANFNTDTYIGQTANIEIEGIAPSATVNIYTSPNLVAPTLNFNGLLWDLDISQMIYLGQTTADANGHADFALPIPNDPALIGTAFYFQGLVNESGALRSTIDFSTVIQ